MSESILYLDPGQNTNLSRIILVTGTLRGRECTVEEIKDRMITKKKVPVVSAYMVAAGGHLSISNGKYLFPYEQIKQWKRLEPKDLPLYLHMPQKTALFTRILNQTYKRLTY
jgi:hypothetical protein